MTRRKMTRRNDPKISRKPILVNVDIDKDVMLLGEVKPFGNSCHVTVPKEYIGLNAVIIIKGKVKP